VKAGRDAAEKEQSGIAGHERASSVKLPETFEEERKMGGWACTAVEKYIAGQSGFCEPKANKNHDRKKIREKSKNK
jgi:hypothetical protein